MSHSPGPWDIWEIPLGNDGEQEHSYRIMAESTLFLTVSPCSDGFQFGQNRANAYLIAASPELLEACKAARRAFAELNGQIYREVWESLYEINQILDAAISKAEVNL